MYDMLTSGNPNMINKALVLIRRSYFPKIKSYILQNSGTPEDANDIFQESLIALYDNVLLQKFRAESSIETYLFAICRNKWLSFLTKQKKGKEIVSSTVSQLETVEIDEVLFAEVLDKISTDCKELLIGFYFHGYSMSVLKEKLNLGSEQTTRNKKYLCMKKLTEVVKARNLTIESFIK